MYTFIHIHLYMYKWYELPHKFKVQDHISHLLINRPVTHTPLWLKFHYHPPKFALLLSKPRTTRFPSFEGCVQFPHPSQQNPGNRPIRYCCCPSPPSLGGSPCPPTPRTPRQQTPLLFCCEDACIGPAGGT